MSNFTIFIRTDGHTDIGLGHLMRCLSIAEYITENTRNKTKFIISKKSACDFAQLSDKEVYILDNGKGDKNEALEIVDLVRKEKGHMILTDSYLLSEQFYKVLRSEIPTVPVMVVDDMGEKASFPVTGFINFGLVADKKLYPAELLKYSALGPEYFPLRNEFFAESKSTLKKIT